MLGPGCSQADKRITSLLFLDRRRLCLRLPKPAALDRLQALRDRLGKPLIVRPA